MIKRFFLAVLFWFFFANFVFASPDVVEVMDSDKESNGLFVLTTYDYQKEKYDFFIKDNTITVINGKNKIVGSFEYTGNDISAFYNFLPYVKIKKDNKYAYYDPKKNKLSKFYDDIRVAPNRASMIFFKHSVYLQYKELGMYRNFDKKITPRKILLFSVEVPIAAVHDIGEMALIFGSFGLYYLFHGSDWWLTGKGVQGLP